MRAVVVRLQTALGAEGVRRRPNVARAVRSHLATGHRPLQQVCTKQTFDLTGFFDGGFVSGIVKTTLLFTERLVKSALEVKSGFATP